MGKIVFASLTPHAPIMIPEVGGEESLKVEKSKKALETIAENLAASNPEVIIFITPHAPVFSDAVGVNTEPELKGSFARFGAPQVKFNYKNELKLVQNIIDATAEKGIPIAEISKELAQEYSLDTKLDHGTMVPLYFISKKGVDVPIVIISISLLEYSKLYSFGMAIKEAILKSDLKAAVIASGDLSHSLTPDAPAGYNKKGKEFDLLIKKCLEESLYLDILEIPHDLSEGAKECGLRPIIILLGVLEGLFLSSDVLSYEGPFGVGYLVAQFNIKGTGESLYEKYTKRLQEKLEERLKNESFPVKIARKSLEKYIKEGVYLEVPEEIPNEFNIKAGAFVTLKKEGTLRGCIGTIVGTRKNVVEEIIHNAVSAGTNDPRFYSVEPDELSELEISVDILLEPEPIKSISELDPKKYGVIVRKDVRSGLLLPNLEGIDTPEEQVEIALKKAGISPEEDFEMERFEVIRYF